MNSRTIRIIREARAIFWPWCAVTFLATLRLLPSPPMMVCYFLRDFGAIGFCVGIPLMATLSLGSEFQYRTLPLLLSQPIDRGKIWAEKWIVLLVAVLSSASVYRFSWPAVFTHELELGLIVALLMVSVCSAMFWTLIARSTIGALALNAFQIGAILIGLSVTDWLLEKTPSPMPVTTSLVIGEAAVVLCYALLMLWLGRRKLARFQATGESAGNDSLVAGPNVLRCRPTGALLNLIRKEVRLLWPVWLLTSLTLLFLLCMTPFRFMRQPNDWALMVEGGVSFFTVGLSAVLSGTLSIGEERMLGTHSWHLTMPVSARRQWLTKLAAAVLTSSACTAAVAIGGQFLLGSTFTQRLYEPFSTRQAAPPLLLLILGFLVLTLAAFWCASAVKGTVRAALWVFPAIGAAFFAYRFGMWGLVRPAPILDFIVSTFHPFPFANTTGVFFQIATFPVAIVLLAVPLLVISLIQSYRLFRTEMRESGFSMIRYLLLPLFVIFLYGFFQQLPNAVLDAAATQTWSVLVETSKAIDKMQLDATKLDAAHPLQLTIEDLAKSSPLSNLTRRWLNNSPITVTPKTITRRLFKNRQWATQTFSYFSTVHLRNDWVCSMYGTDYVVFSCASPSGRWGFPNFP